MKTAIRKPGHCITNRWMFRQIYLGELPTRIVVPLVSASAVKKPIPVLQPELEIKGQRVYLQTAQLAGVSQNLLGSRICSARASRDQIIAAIDLAFVGY